ncbi:MAG: peptidoglycan DD-metalloendopeptidase family protein [Patulibacter sp.]
MSRMRSRVLIGDVCLVLATVGVVLVGGVLRPPPARAASADVAALQVAMKAVGLYTGRVDGVTGPRTLRAVVRFQRGKKLTADGVAGPRTRKRLGRRGTPSLGSRPMRRGHRGWDVAALQFLLRSRGFSAGAVDGGFGGATLAAVRRFQRAARLSRDNVAGPRTIAALRRKTVSAPKSASASPTVADPVRFLRPVPGPSTDGFGRVGGRRHTGLDFPLATGDPISAAGRGVVSFAGYNAFGYGNLVVVSHRLGFESWYAHLSTIAVSAGQAVNGGTLIGAGGSTGRSTGPHLHFEVRRNGTPIDPIPRLLGAAARAGGVTNRRPSADGSAPRIDHGAAARAGSTPTVRTLRCRPNADARSTRDSDPFRARIDRCP